MTELRAPYVRTEVGVERILREKRMGESASKKSWRSVSCSVPVPQTDTGGRGEQPQVRERIMVKELGKMTL
jgi:hypothetical protein